jgi:hypothetical protein
MNKAFDGVQFKGVVKPGEIYILYYFQIDEISCIYTIRTDEEAFAALNLHAALLDDAGDRVEKYLGIKKVSWDDHDEETYEIRLLCRDKDTGKLCIERLTLERLHSFQEEFDWMKARFPVQ